MNSYKFAGRILYVLHVHLGKADKNLIYRWKLKFSLKEHHKRTVAVTVTWHEMSLLVQKKKILSESSGVSWLTSSRGDPSELPGIDNQPPPQSVDATKCNKILPPLNQWSVTFWRNSSLSAGKLISGGLLQEIQLTTPRSTEDPTQLIKLNIQKRPRIEGGRRE